MTHAPIETPLALANATASLAADPAEGDAGSNDYGAEIGLIALGLALLGLASLQFVRRLCRSLASSVTE